MLYALHVSIYDCPKPRIESIVDIPTERSTGSFRTKSLGCQKEDVGTSIPCNKVDVMYDVGSNTVLACVEDELGINVYRSTALTSS